MGMISRMSVIVKSRMNRVLDSAEDPGETLDYSYEKQLEMLRGVKRGVVEMVAAKRQIQQQASKIQENVSKLDLQARQSIAAGREDMARLALQRKQTAVLELEGLDEQISGMDLEQEKLIQAEQRLQAKVAAFRTKKEVIKAQFTSARAQVRIGSALSGISEEMGDIGLAIERAEIKTGKMRAKAGAIDELADGGFLDDFTGGSNDDISQQLEKLTASQNVEDELASLKAGLSASETKEADLPASETKEPDLPASETKEVDGN